MPFEKYLMTHKEESDHKLYLGKKSSLYFFFKRMACRPPTVKAGNQNTKLHGLARAGYSCSYGIKHKGDDCYNSFINSKDCHNGTVNRLLLAPVLQ